MFIKLTDSDATHIYINPTHIKTFYPEGGGRGSVISFVGASEYDVVDVEESPEEIMDKIIDLWD